MNPQLMNILSMLSGGYDTEDEELQNWLRQMSQQQMGQQRRRPMMMAGLNNQPMPTAPTHRTPLNIPGRMPLEAPFRTNPQGPVRNMIPPMRG